MVLESAKRFSDFLAFHVRLLFCAQVSGLAFAIPATNMLESWRQGVEYRASSYALELSIFLLFAIYAIVMATYILAVGWEYIGPSRCIGLACKSVRFLMAVIFVVLELAAVAAILYFSTVQLLGLLNVNLALAECTLNEFLSQTSYPFTPTQPTHCAAD